MSAAAVVLLLTAAVEGWEGVEAGLSVIALEALPATIGASFARSQLGVGRARGNRREARGRELFLMGAGAVVLAANIAPTEEVVLIAARMTPVHGVLLVLFELLLVHAFVYRLDFRGAAGQPPRGDAGPLRGPRHRPAASPRLGFHHPVARAGARVRGGGGPPGCHDSPVPGTGDVDAAAARLFAGMLRRTHLSAPADVPDVVVEQAQETLDARDVVIHLVNHELTALVPVPSRHSPPRPEQPIDGSMAGRCFTSSAVLLAEVGPEGPAGGRRLWLPLLDGTDRLGVLELLLPTEDGAVAPGLLDMCERFAHLVAQLVVAKSAYGDVFERVRRSRPLTVASELLHSMLPPATCATDGLVISSMLEPAYDNGGDAFDYALNGDRVHLAVFDGMGHGLAAAGVTTFAVAAYRHARRVGLPLPATYAAIDEAVLSQFGGDRHVTAVLAELDLPTGRLTWVSAGHPPPLLLRGAKFIKALTAPPSFPLGWSFEAGVTVAEEHLQPGDLVLLYTDGLIEARRPDHSFLSIEGLARFLEQEAAAGQPAPETLRRLRRAFLGHQEGVLQDDATALLVEWSRGTERALVPQTVA